MSSDKGLDVNSPVSRGVLVFAAGMALSAVSFLVEQAIIRAAQGRR